MRPHGIFLNEHLFDADSLPAFVLRAAWSAIYEAMRQQNRALTEALRADDALYPVDAERQRAFIRAFLTKTDRDLVLE